MPDVPEHLLQGSCLFHHNGQFYAVAEEATAGDSRTFVQLPEGTILRLKRLPAGQPKKLQIEVFPRSELPAGARIIHAHRMNLG